MIYMENRFRGKNTSKSLPVLTLKQALIVGLFQCLAILPGMSRSASTIIGGWVAGLSSVAAAEFSFFLAVPVMVGMSFLKLLKIGGLSGITSIELISLFVGFIISFFVAIIVVNKFVNYLKKKPMKVFAYYRFVFGIVVLISGFLGMFTMKG